MVRVLFVFLFSIGLVFGHVSSCFAVEYRSLYSDCKRIASLLSLTRKRPPDLALENFSTHRFDEGARQVYLSRIDDPSLREAMEFLTGQIRLGTQKEFETQLRQAMHEFLSPIPKGRKVYFVINPQEDRRSPRWTAYYAMSLAPKGYRIRITSIADLMHHLRHVPDDDKIHIAIVDDGIYSGDQALTSVRILSERLYPHFDTSQVDIAFLSAFAHQRAYNFIHQDLRAEHTNRRYINYRFAVGEWMPSIMDLLERGVESGKISESVRAYVTNELSYASSEHRPEVFVSQGLYIPFHKFPDKLSVPVDVFQGWLYSDPLTKIPQVSPFIRLQEVPPYRSKVWLDYWLRARFRIGGSFTHR